MAQKQKPSELLGIVGLRVVYPYLNCGSYPKNGEKPN
jgi:hypothetical protein